MCTNPLHRFVSKSGKIFFRFSKVLTVKLDPAFSAFSPSGAVSLESDSKKGLRYVDSVPCGGCVECRLDHSRMWAARCQHELRYHAESCFLTLTYDDKHVPGDFGLVKKHVQDFNKRLRKFCGDDKIKIFYCGEYGDKYGRPHYHLIVFGVDFHDKKIFKKNKFGQTLYSSDKLAKLWTMGFSSLGAVTFDSCAYVARYTLKKVSKRLEKDAFARIDAQGVLRSRIQPFAHMSNGIGEKYFLEFCDQIYRDDFIVVTRPQKNSLKVKVPRYYDKLYVKHKGLDALEKVKRKRIDRAKSAPERTDEQLSARREIVESRQKTFSRNFENVA